MILTCIIISLYVILILFYRIGWSRLEISNVNTISQEISVVIALRNEEKNIARLIQELNNQSYNHKKIEFIMIDDHSEDATLKLLYQHQEKLKNLTILQQEKGSFGKKNAIIKGIQESSGEIIVTTDADCSFHKNWLTSITNYFIDPDIKLVVGPVGFSNIKNIWERFQELEFLSLVGSGASSIGIKRGIFCNGANLAYKRDLIIDNNHKIFKKNIASGDDVFLMHYIKRRFPDGVVFAKSEEAIVKTHPISKIDEFINQRKRWTAKSMSYRDIDSIFAGTIVFLTNLLFPTLIIASCFEYELLYYLIIFLLLKFIVDALFLYPVLNFFKRRSLLKFILFFELIYSFYILLIVIVSFTSSFIWKGRSYKQ
ncbi:MAG: glycosyltransferase [Bacteroidota bacterium]|nr:glycosyltransferase [Bacteroidota bacterium]